MLKSSRLSVAFSAQIVLILLVQIAAVTSSHGSQEPAAGNGDAKSAQTTKASKKRKKKKTSATVPYIVLAPVQTGVSADPVVIKPATVTVEAPPAPRNTSAAMRTPSIHVIPTAVPLPLIAATAGQLLISEFRLRGPSGANDEFVEIYNNSGADHTVTASSGSGYGLAASDGTTRCTIPNGTVIPNKGHYLCTNSGAYSLGGNATGDATYTTDIPDNAGIALFNNDTGGGSYSLANRLDAVGSTSEANTTYKEGTGYPALTPFSIDYAWLRDECGKGGAVNLLGPCSISTPKDTDVNSTDFYFVDTNGTSAGGGQRLGAPGPQNLASPIQRNSSITANLLDATVAASNPPNRVRDFTSDPANNSTFGTLSIRRRWVNNTGASITRLRYRIIDLDTFPAASGFADMRPRTSGAVVVAGINDTVTCSATGAPVTPPCTATVQGTTLEQPPSQPNGGGFNSTLSAGTVTLGTPLANGASINLQFLLGLQQTGNFRIYVNVEILP